MSNVFDKVPVQAGPFTNIGLRAAISPQQVLQPDEFEKGLSTGLQGVSGGFKGAAAQMIEPFAPDLATQMFNEAQADMLRVQQQNTLRVPEFTDVNSLSSFGDWAAGALGQGLPSSTAGFGGAMVGRGLGKAFKLNPIASSFAGSAAGMFPQEMGESALDLRADPVAMANTTAMGRLGLSGLKGGINSALESIVPTYTVNRMIKPGAIGKGVLGKLSHVGKLTAQGAAGEFLTEGAQQGVGDIVHHTANTAHTAIDPKGMFNAGMAGAVSGAGMGAVGGIGGVAKDMVAPSPDSETPNLKERVVDGIFGLVGAAAKGVEKVKQATERIFQRKDYNDYYVGNPDFQTITTHDKAKSQDPGYQKGKVESADRYAEGIIKNWEGVAAKDDDIFTAALKYRDLRNKGAGYGAADEFGETIRHIHKVEEETGKYKKLSEMLTRSDSKRSEMGTTDDETFSKLKDALKTEFEKHFPSRGGNSGAVQRHREEREKAMDAMWNFGLRGFKLQYKEDGETVTDERLPARFRDALGDKAPAVIRFVAESLKRQGIKGFSDKMYEQGIKLADSIDSEVKFDNKFFEDAEKALSPLGRVDLAKDNTQGIEGIVHDLIKKGLPANLLSHYFGDKALEMGDKLAQYKEQSLGGKLKQDFYSEAVSQTDDQNEDDLDASAFDDGGGVVDRDWDEFDPTSDERFFTKRGKTAAGSTFGFDKSDGDYETAVKEAKDAIEKEHGYGLGPKLVGAGTAFMTNARAKAHRNRAEFSEDEAHAELIRRYSKKIDGLDKMSGKDAIKAVDARFHLFSIDKGSDQEKLLIHPHMVQGLKAGKPNEEEFTKRIQKMRDAKATKEEIERETDKFKNWDKASHGTLFFEQQNGNKFPVKIAALLRHMSGVKQQDVTQKLNTKAVRDKVLAAVSSLLNSDESRFKVDRVGYKLTATGDQIHWLSGKWVEGRAGNDLEGARHRKFVFDGLPDEFAYDSSLTEKNMRYDAREEDDSWSDKELTAAELGELTATELKKLHTDTGVLLGHIYDFEEEFGLDDELKAQKQKVESLFDKIEEFVFRGSKPFNDNPSERSFGDLNTATVMEQGFENGEHRKFDDHGDPVEAPKLRDDERAFLQWYKARTEATKAPYNFEQRESFNLINAVDRKFLGQKNIDAALAGFRSLLAKGMPAFVVRMKQEKTYEELAAFYQKVVSAIGNDLSKKATAQKFKWKNVPGMTKKEIVLADKAVQLIGARLSKMARDDTSKIDKEIADTLDKELKGMPAALDNWLRSHASEEDIAKETAKVTKARKDEAAAEMAKVGEVARMRQLKDEIRERLATAYGTVKGSPQNMNRTPDKEVLSDAGEFAKAVVERGHVRAITMIADDGVINSLIDGIKEMIAAVHPRKKTPSAVHAEPADLSVLKDHLKTLQDYADRKSFMNMEDLFDRKHVGSLRVARTHIDRLIPETEGKQREKLEQRRELIVRVGKALTYMKHEHLHNRDEKVRLQNSSPSAKELAREAKIKEFQRKILELMGKSASDYSTDAKRSKMMEELGEYGEMTAEDFAAMDEYYYGGEDSSKNEAVGAKPEETYTPEEAPDYSNATLMQLVKSLGGITSKTLTDEGLPANSILRTQLVGKHDLPSMVEYLQAEGWSVTEQSLVDAIHDMSVERDRPISDAKKKEREFKKVQTQAKKELQKLEKKIRQKSLFSRMEGVFSVRREFDAAINAGDVVSAKRLLDRMYELAKVGDAESKAQYDKIWDGVTAATVRYRREMESLRNQDPSPTGLERARALRMQYGNSLRRAMSEMNTVEEAAMEAISPETRQAIKDEVAKTLGDRVRLLLRPFLGNSVSGSWTPGADGTKNIIRIALNAMDHMGVVRHESIHEFLDMLRKAGATEMLDALEKAAMAAPIQEQLQLLLKDHPKALEQLKDKDEAIAYMYQFWRAKNADGSPMLKVGPKTDTWFQKVKKFFADILGLMSDEYKEQAVAFQILTSFREGYFAKDADVAMQVVEKKVAESKEIIAQGNKLWKAITQNKILQNAVYSNWQVLKDANIPYLDELSKMFHVAEGGKINAEHQAYLDASKQQRHIYLSKLSELYHEVKLNPDEMRTATEYMIKGTPTSDIHHERIKNFVHGYRTKVLQPMLAYARAAKVARWDKEKKAWVPMGDLGPHYFHIRWDTEAVLGKEKEFSDKLKQEHMDVLEELVKDAKEEREANKHISDVAASNTAAEEEITVDHIITAIIKQMTDVNGADDMHESSFRLGISPFASAVNKRTLSWINHEKFMDFIDKEFETNATNYIVQMTKRAEYTRAFGLNGEMIQKQIDRAYAYKLLGSKAAVEDAEKELASYKKSLREKYGYSEDRDEHHEELLALMSVKSIDDLKADLKAREARIARYKEPNLIKLMNEEQEIIKAEIEKREKGDGTTPAVPFKRKTLRSIAESRVKGEEKEVAKKIADANAALATPIRAVMALEGTLGRDIPQSMQKMMQGLTAYQNARLLMFTLFTSFVDPAGVIVRGGTMNQAFNTFTRGIRSVKDSWTGHKDGPDRIRKISMYMGITEAGIYRDILAETYSNSFTGSGAINKFNNALFRIIGMEGWNRGVREQATMAAMEFIETHLKNPTEHSKRYLLDELGLDPANKDAYLWNGEPSYFMQEELRTEGGLDITLPVVQRAVLKWVDGAVLNPNAAHRPILASDPHYQLVYHLKQFAYTFHNVILRRVGIEMSHGNYSPMVSMLATYIPIIIAADVIKSMLLPGEPPEWTRSLPAMLLHGLDRSGIGGIPQLVVDGLPVVGNGHVAGLFGPVADQLSGILMTPFSPYHTLPNEVLGAMPGGTALRRLSPAPVDPDLKGHAGTAAVGILDDLLPAIAGSVAKRRPI